MNLDQLTGKSHSFVRYELFRRSAGGQLLFDYLRKEVGLGNELPPSHEVLRSFLTDNSELAAAIYSELGQQFDLNGVAERTVLHLVLTKVMHSHIKESFEGQLQQLNLSPNTCASICLYNHVSQSLRSPYLTYDVGEGPYIRLTPEVPLERVVEAYEEYRSDIQQALELKALVSSFTTGSPLPARKKQVRQQKLRESNLEGISTYLEIERLLLEREKSPTKEPVGTIFYNLAETEVGNEEQDQLIELARQRIVSRYYTVIKRYSIPTLEEIRKVFPI